MEAAAIMQQKLAAALRRFAIADQGVQPDMTALLVVFGGILVGITTALLLPA